MRAHRVIGFLLVALGLDVMHSYVPVTWFECLVVAGTIAIGAAIFVGAME